MSDRTAWWLLVPLALAAACAAPAPAAVRAHCEREILRAKRAGKLKLAEELRADCREPGVVHEPTQGPIPPDTIAPPSLHSQGAQTPPVNDPATPLKPSIDGR